MLRRHPRLSLGFVLPLLLAMAGCYYLVYEPTVCRREHVDTVGVVLTGSGQVTGHLINRECAIWQSFSDSTKCWDNRGQRLPGCQLP